MIVGYSKNKLNLFFSILSNLVSTLTTAFVTLVLPKIMSTESYGYYQLFIFYAGYLGILHLGWADGFYLRSCGTYFEELDKKNISTQIKIYAIVQFIWCIIISFFACQNPTEDKRIVFMFLAVLTVISNIKQICIYLLQATSHIMDASIANMVSNVIYLVGTVFFVVYGIGNYRLYLFLFVGVNVIGLFISGYYCRELLDFRFCEIENCLEEIKQNIIVGIKVMAANFSSILIIGIVRWAVQKQWNVETFAKISLTLSVSNLFMTFINAIAIVLLPMIKRMDMNKLTRIYNDLAKSMMIILYGMMVFYYPTYRILVWWLPHYAESLKYMAVLFPICLYESKNSMLLNTYLKALRKESAIMIINFVTVVISAIGSIGTVFIAKRLDWTIYLIIVVLMFRCICGEVYLSKCIEVKAKKNIIEDVFITVSFIIASYIIGGESGFLIYATIYIVYIILNKKYVVEILRKCRVR